MGSKRSKTTQITRGSHRPKHEGDSASARAGSSGAPDDPKPTALAKDAGDLEPVRKAVEDAAAVSVGLWLSYLFVLFYIAIAAGAVTHVDLLLRNPVKLPFLNIELPLLAFFGLAPLLFIIAHVYTLVHFVMLAAKLGRFDQEICRQFPHDENAREALRRRLPNNIFVQFLAGPMDIRAGGLGFLLKLIAWITLVFGPVLLLLLLQVQFLPYHDDGVTWVHRLALLADLMLLWALWPAILASRSVIRSPQLSRSKTAVAATLCAIWFSWIVATFPGELQKESLTFLQTVPTDAEFVVRLQSQQIKLVDNKRRTTLNDLLFNGEVDDVSRRRKSPFSSTLVLPDFNIYATQKIDDPNKVEWRDTLIDLRGRDLKGAVFRGANLTRADLIGAHLQNASLDDALLQSAHLSGAWLTGASLNRSNLLGASLSRAHLQGVSLDLAQLQGALLDDAELQGASLFGANLEGAQLFGAQLQGASLDDARLQGASLVGARLLGAQLIGALLHGASLDRAQLLGTSLFRAKLDGASLIWAQLQGASFENSNLFATDFSHAFL